MRPVFDQAPLTGPDDGQHVWLLLDDQIVNGVIRPGEVDSEIQLEGDVPHPLPHRGLLEYMTDEGIIRRPGTLTAPDCVTPSTVRLTPSGQPQLLLASRLLRTEVEVPVIVHRADGRHFETHSIDLSESGALLAAASGEPLEAGERLQLTIFLSRLGEPVRTSSVVVQITDEGHADIHHTKLDRENMEELGLQLFARVVGERKRAAAARSAGG